MCDSITYWFPLQVGEWEFLFSGFQPLDESESLMERVFLYRLLF